MRMLVLAGLVLALASCGSSGLPTPGPPTPTPAPPMPGPTVRANSTTPMAVSPVAPTPVTSPGSGDRESPSAAVTAGHFADGLPRSVGGLPVLRGAEVLAHARDTTTDAPFLVGVWLDVYTGPRSCPVYSTSLPADSWLHGCPPWIQASDEAGSGASVLRDVGSATFRFATGLVSGPAVVQVHVHDRRATDCGSDSAICDRMIVVDQAVWTGDDQTSPRPLTVEATCAAIRKVDPAVSIRVLGDADMRIESGLADAVSLSSGSDGTADGQLVGVYLMPSIAAMRRALPSVTAGPDGSLLPEAVHWSTNGSNGQGRTYSLVARWLVVGNVALSVLTLPTPSAVDRSLVARLATALSASR